MYKYSWIIITLVIFMFTGIHAIGTTKLSLSFSSKILNQDIKYSVYLPPSYNDSSKTFPVLYLLHGYTDDETTWLKSGRVDESINEGIKNGDMQEMIIVMPDGGLNWFVNAPQGNYNYEDMFIQEFIPWIDKNYHTKVDRKARYIGGLSMGGYGALRYAMRYSDLFSCCVAYSSALRLNEEILKISQGRFDELYSHVYGEGIKGEARLSKHWNENNPLYLAEKIKADNLNKVDWYIFCGKDDSFLTGNSVLVNIFKERGIKYKNLFNEGDHDWGYWSTYIKNGLEFITKMSKEE